MLRVLPPAPQAGDERDLRDRDIFEKTRKLDGTARWTLAISDAQITIAALLRTFRCAMGMLLTPEQAPKLATLLSKAVTDSNASVNRFKLIYKRERPFELQPGPICTPPPTRYDYPSGHSSIGMTMALILTELEPDRATELLERGRAFGESRVVCGVHYASAVNAGEIHAAAIVAALHAVPEFRSDLNAVRTELAGLRKNSAAPQDCAEEAGLLSKRWYAAP
jgi:acid phosphatase (class A)